MAYGKTLDSVFGDRSLPRDQKSLTPSPDKNILERIVTYQVPHSNFTHFYIVSIVSSLFWGSQILIKGVAIKAISDHGIPRKTVSTMSMEQVNLLWSLMLIHSCRRLYECICVAAPSTSTMPLTHYILGLLFYLGAPVAIWIEGTGEQMPVRQQDHIDD